MPVPVPDPVVTATFTRPADPAGVVAVIDVALTTVTPVAATPPIVTPVVPEKPVPVIVTEVPPEVEPVAGDTEVTVGATAPYVNRPVPVADSALGFVTTTV